MREHKNRSVIGRIVAPPPLPGIAGPVVPWTPNRSKHVAAQDPGANIFEGLLGHIVVDTLRPFTLTMHLLECVCCEKPPVQFQPANPERILQILRWASPKPVERNRKRSNSDFAHALLSAMSNGINLDGSEGVRERQFEGERGAASLRFLEAQQSFDTTSPTL